MLLELFTEVGKPRCLMNASGSLECPSIFTVYKHI